MDIDGIRNLMAEIWRIDPKSIPCDARFNSFLPWDSLGHVQLMAFLEERCAIEIGPETLAELVSIPAIISYLSTHQTGKPL